jgi:hypothetical protein
MYANLMTDDVIQIREMMTDDTGAYGPELDSLTPVFAWVTEFSDQWNEEGYDGAVLAYLWVMLAARPSVTRGEDVRTHIARDLFDTAAVELCRAADVIDCVGPFFVKLGKAYDNVVSIAKSQGADGVEMLGIGDWLWRAYNAIVDEYKAATKEPKEEDKTWSAIASQDIEDAASEEFEDQRDHTPLKPHDYPRVTPTVQTSDGVYHCFAWADDMHVVDVFSTDLPDAFHGVSALVMVWAGMAASDKKKSALNSKRWALIQRAAAYQSSGKTGVIAIHVPALDLLSAIRDADDDLYDPEDFSEGSDRDNE